LISSIQFRKVDFDCGLSYYGENKESMGDFMRMLVIFIGLLFLSLILTTTLKQQPKRYVIEDLQVETIRQRIDTFEHGIFMIDVHGHLFGMGGTENESLIFEHSDQLIPLNDYFSLEEDEYFISIHASDDNALALTSNHRLFSWGQNRYGNTGSGSDEEWVSIPIDITDYFDLSDDERIAQIIMKPNDAMMDYNPASFVLTTEGNLYGFGYNFSAISLLSQPFYNMGIDYYDVAIDYTYYITHPYLMNHEFQLGYDEIIISISPISALTSYGRLFVWNRDLYKKITDITDTIILEESEHITKVDDGGELYETNQGRVFSIIYTYDYIYTMTLYYADTYIEISNVQLIESFKIAHRTSIILVTEQYETYARYGGREVPIGINPRNLPELNPNLYLMPVNWSNLFLEDETIIEIKMNSTHMMMLTSNQRVLICGHPDLKWKINENDLIDYELNELNQIN
jgi:hypothetical protein